MILDEVSLAESGNCDAGLPTFVVVVVVAAVVVIGTPIQITQKFARDIACNSQFR